MNSDPVTGCTVCDLNSYHKIYIHMVPGIIFVLISYLFLQNQTARRMIPMLTPLIKKKVTGRDFGQQGGRTGRSTTSNPLWIHRTTTLCRKLLNFPLCIYTFLFDMDLALFLQVLLHIMSLHDDVLAPPEVELVRNVDKVYLAATSTVIDRI